MLNKLVVLFFLCLATPVLAGGLFGPKCKGSDEAKPSWVNADYNYGQAGSLYGFGEAPYQGKNEYNKQKAEAESHARASLVNSIHVQVSSELEVNTSENKTNSNVQYRHDVSQKIRVSSNIELPGLPIKSSWQDKETCRLYVLVELNKQVAQLISQKAILLSMVDDAEDKQVPLHIRLSAIDNAIEMAGNIEFGELQNTQPSKFLLKEYQIIKVTLQKQLKGRRNMMFFISGSMEQDKVLREKVISKLSGQIQGSFPGAPCSEVTECLTLAQKTIVPYMTIVQSDLSVKKDRGFYIGEYDLVVSVWDMRNNKKIFSSEKSEIFKPISVMTRQKFTLSQVMAFDKWAKFNIPSVSHLQQYYQ
ncbi:MAG: LPP20 family lipoprotein [Acinetobacter sp.]|nr:LPP20 family lipoprotein [Acinetobacter sp.]